MEDVQTEKKKEKPVAVKAEPDEPKIDLTAFAVLKGILHRRATFYRLRHESNNQELTLSQWEKLYNGVIK